MYDYTEHLHWLTNVLDRSTDADQALTALMDYVVKTIPCDYVCIFLSESDSIRVFSQYCDTKEPLCTPAWALDLLHEMQATGCTAVVARSESDPQAGTIHRIGAPLIARGKILGLLSVACTQRGPYGALERVLAQACAQQAAMIVENTTLLTNLRASQEQLRLLSMRLIEAQESERCHIARELHDEIGQALTVIKMNLQAAQRQTHTPAAIPYLEEGLRTVDLTMRQVRDLSLDLRPSLLDDLGLAPALEWYIEQLAQRTGLHIVHAIEAMDARLAPSQEITVFRIVQEALTNVLRHAQAKTTTVKLWRCNGEVNVTVTDDGDGFDTESSIACAAHDASLGLLGMKERALLLCGEIQIRSHPGQGTEVHVRFPIVTSLPASAGRKEEHRHEPYTCSAR